MIEVAVANGAKFTPKAFTGNINLPYYGNVFYVHSTTGSDSANNGSTPSTALATIDAAINQCTANNSDIILVLPGHAETITSSSTTIDVEGVRIIGLGQGLKRPTLTFGAAAATINVSAANCSVENIHHIGNFDNVAAAYTLAAAKDFRLENNSFVDNSDALHFLSILVTNATNNAADGLTIKNNTWQGMALAPNAFISVLANLDRLNITGNFVQMLATNDAGHFLTLSSKVILGARITDNTLIVTGSTDATVGIFLTGSATTCTGVVSGNKVASLDTTTELIATAGTKLSFFENYYTGTADASGKLWPVVDAA